MKVSLLCSNLHTHTRNNHKYLEARFDRRLRIFGAVMFTAANVSLFCINASSKRSTCRLMHSIDSNYSFRSDTCR